MKVNKTFETLDYYLDKVPNETILIRYEGGLNYSAESLLAWIRELRSNHPCLEMASIALITSGNLDIAISLVAFDGWAGKVLLVPSSVYEDKVLMTSFLQSAGISHLVNVENGQFSIEELNSEVGYKKVQFNQTEWILPTSGTTSKPKLVSHTLNSLTRTVRRNHEDDSKIVWGLVYDLNRFAGIQVYLQSLISGGGLLIPRETSDIGNIVGFFIKNDCNAISATPSLWRRLLMVPFVEKLKLDLITLGGEISTASILAGLSGVFPNSKVIHIYASTEAGVGFSVKDGKEGFPRSYLNSKKYGAKFKVNERGGLCIQPDVIDQSYLSGKKIVEDDGYIETGDLVSVQGDRVLFVGRESGAINVGGNKVQPEEVEKILIASGLTSMVRVYSKSNSILGQLVCADVVPGKVESDLKELKRELMVYCRSNLESYKIPAFIKFVEDISLSENGKMVR